MESGVNVNGAARHAARRASALLGLSSTVCNVAMHKYKAPSAGWQGEAQVAFGEEQGAPSFGCKLGLMAELLKETLNADSAFVVHLTPAPHCDPAEVGIGAHVATAGSRSPDPHVICDEYPEELVQLALANLSERDPIYEVPDGGAALAGRELEPGRAASIAEKVGAGPCIWRLCSAFGTPWALVAVHSRAPGRPFTAENRAVLGAVGDCVGMSLALVWASEPAPRDSASTSPVAWPGAPKPRKRPSLRDAVAGAGPMEGLLRVLEDLGCDCAAIDRTALASLAAEIELSLVVSGKQSQDPTRAVAWATLEELSSRAQTLQGQVPAEDFASIVAWAEPLGVHCAIERALELAEQATGLVTIGWLRPRALSKHELSIFQCLTDQIGHALSRAELLRSMTKDIRSTLESRRVIETTAKLLREAYGADVVEIMTVSRQPSGACPDPEREGRGRGPGRGAAAAVGGEGEICVTDVAICPEGGPNEADPSIWPVFRRRFEALAKSRPHETVQIEDMLKAQASDWAGEEPHGPEGLADETTVAAVRKLGVRSMLARITSTADGQINGIFTRPARPRGRPRPRALTARHAFAQVKWNEAGRTFKPAELALFEDACEARQSATVVGVALAHAALAQQAQQDARAKADFLSVITHEMRTPMQAVIGITDLLLDMKPSIEQREYLSVIRSCGQALVDLVSEVLDASAVERGNQLRIAVAPMDLRSAAEEVMDMLWPVASRSNLALQLRMKAGVPRFIVSDKSRIRQVAINLVGNGTKFSEEGRVILEVEAEGSPDADGRTLFRITVTGPPASHAHADQRRLFKFFTQLDPRKSRQHRGTGLGLFISLHIAEALGGGLEVVSTPGTGRRARAPSNSFRRSPYIILGPRARSTFSFTFRAAAVQHDDPLLPLLKAAAGDAVLRGKAFIIAVDEPVWAGTIAVDTARWGMRLIEVRSVEDTFAAIQAEVGAGRGGEIGGVLFYMPSLVSKDQMADVVDSLCEELQRAKSAGDLAPAPVIPLRIHVPLAPWARRENVYSLRLPVSEHNLHECLVQGFRARRDASVPRSIPRSHSETEVFRQADTLAPAFDEELPRALELEPPPPCPAPAVRPRSAPDFNVGPTGFRARFRISQAGSGVAEGAESRSVEPSMALQLAAAPAPAVVPVLPPAPAATDRAQLRILFSEDTPARPARAPSPPRPRRRLTRRGAHAQTNAKIVMVQLRKLGYARVVHAGDGREALEAARAAEARGEPFDLLLSDIMMPRMDGLESLRRMRAELPPARLPYAIALSGAPIPLLGARPPAPSAHARGSERGGAGPDRKPVRAAELEAALVTAAERLARRRRRRSTELAAPAGAGAEAAAAEAELGAVAAEMEAECGQGTMLVHGVEPGPGRGLVGALAAGPGGPSLAAQRRPSASLAGDLERPGSCPPGREE
eukprot:tig00000788_g4091.t1